MITSTKTAIRIFATGGDQERTPEAATETGNSKPETRHEAVASPTYRSNPTEPRLQQGPTLAFVTPSSRKITQRQCAEPAGPRSTIPSLTALLGLAPCEARHIKHGQQGAHKNQRKSRSRARGRRMSSTR